MWKIGEITFPQYRFCRQKSRELTLTYSLAARKSFLTVSLIFSHSFTNLGVVRIIFTGLRPDGLPSKYCANARMNSILGACANSHSEWIRHLGGDILMITHCNGYSIPKSGKHQDQNLILLLINLFNWENSTSYKFWTLKCKLTP